LLTYSFGVIKWSKTNLQNINIQTRVLFTKFCKHHPKSAIERFNLPRENGGRGFSNLEILQHNQIASLKNYFLNRARDNTFFNALISADKGYTPLNLSDSISAIFIYPYCEIHIFNYFSICLLTTPFELLQNHLTRVQRERRDPTHEFSS
jgi:hypothetical protein